MNDTSPTTESTVKPTARSREGWFWTSRGFAPGTGGISFLAILESLLSSAAFLTLVFVFGNFFLIPIAMVTAPFAMLRTTYSDKYTIQFANKLNFHFRLLQPWNLYVINNKTRPSTKFISGMGAIYISIVVMLHAVFSRPLAVIIALFRHPFATLCAMPENWKRLCVSVDLRSPIEVLPGKPRLSGYDPILQDIYQNFVHYTYAFIARDKSSINVSVLFSILFSILITVIVIGLLSAFGLSLDGVHIVLLFNVLLVVHVLTGFILYSFIPLFFSFIVTYWYRFSIKSTSPIWLSLLAIATDISSPGWTAERRLKSIRTDVLSAIFRWFGLFSSLFIVFYWAVKALKTKLHLWLVEHVYFVDYFFGGPGFVALGAWQFASVINTFLAWALYVLADKELERRENHEGHSDQLVNRILKTVSAFRWLLFLFSTACTLIIACKIIRESNPVDWYLLFTPLDSPPQGLIGAISNG